MLGTSWSGELVLGTGRLVLFFSMTETDPPETSNAESSAYLDKYHAIFMGYSIYD